jgi:hypothetical protein
VLQAVRAGLLISSLILNDIYEPNPTPVCLYTVVLLLETGLEYLILTEIGEVGLVAIQIT